MHDFVKSLAKIREKQPDIYNPKTTFFEADYNQPEKNEKKSNSKNAIYYKDMVRNELLGGKNESNDQKSLKLTEETPVEEQLRLKKEFQIASKLEQEEEQNFFSIKKKTQQEMENENVLFDKFLKEEAQKNKPDEVEMLKRFWGDETKLDETDRFLRRYIITKG